MVDINYERVDSDETAALEKEMASLEACDKNTEGGKIVYSGSV